MQEQKQTTAQGGDSADLDKYKLQALIDPVHDELFELAESQEERIKRLVKRNIAVYAMDFMFFSSSTRYIDQFRDGPIDALWSVNQRSFTDAWQIIEGISQLGNLAVSGGSFKQFESVFINLITNSGELFVDRLDATAIFITYLNFAINAVMLYQGRKAGVESFKQTIVPIIKYLNGKYKMSRPAEESVVD